MQVKSNKRIKKKSKKEKRYFFSVVEEGVMNPAYAGFRGGRIEVYDQKSDDKYPCYEARFFIPSEFMEVFRDVWDFKESDKMPFIEWDYSEREKDTP
jgi:hypothetical protein